MSHRRVVITGIGVITPIGNDLATFWTNCKNGVSGVGPVTLFNAENFECRIAGEVKGFEPGKYFKDQKDVRRSDRYTQLSMGAASMALAQSGVELERMDLERVGVIIGSGIGGLKSLCDQHINLINKGPNRVSPFMIPMMISNMASGLVAMEFGFGGPNMSIVTACATANNCIGEAWRMIRTGAADAFLAGGAEAAVVDIGLAGFASMKALSKRNDAPEKASRPFDQDRDGFVLGEGAGVIFMESLEHAQARGAEILAELAGYGATCDAYHTTSPLPEGQGAGRAMEIALNEAQMSIDDVGYINAHATSTDVGDVCETRAIHRVFKDQAMKVSVSSTKSMTGHLLGAAGSVELAVCVMAIKEGVIPPTINLDNPDPRCDLDCTPHHAKERKIKAALNNSFGFGGHNATLLVKAFE
jgi:3-oxoacyl-[acyl-carrier-protein] synthase II